MNHTLAELIDKRLSRWFRSDRKRPPRFLAGLKQSVRVNPSKTVRELAKNRDIRRINASRAVRNIFGMKSFVRRRRNIYTARSREIQAKKCPLLLNHLKNRRGHVKISVDGKKFIVKEVTNRQRSRLLACTPLESLRGCKAEIFLLWWCSEPCLAISLQLGGQCSAATYGIPSVRFHHEIELKYNV